MKRDFFSVGGTLGLAFWFLLTAAQAEPTLKDVDRALERTPQPVGSAEFESVPHLTGMNQGRTSICWSFATCSFVESEMARLRLEPVRLSVIYPVYCRYIEKARRYVQTKGNSRFDPGDLFSALPEVCQQYGALPAAVYGPNSEKDSLNQERLDAQLARLMKEVQQKGDWEEGPVLAEVKRILDRHLGRPPAEFGFRGSACTPRSFAAEVVRLPWNEYVMITSFQYAPFHTRTEFRVPDNWRHNTNYLNLPLAEFYSVLRQAVQRGFSVVVSVDVTEPSYRMTGRHCLVPETDVPTGSITQDAREVRFADGRTADDHAIHVIGYTRCGDHDWFLAKDSCNGTWRHNYRGEIFLHESYVKLKILAFMVHRDALPAGTL